MKHTESIASRAALAVRRTRDLDDTLDDLTPALVEWRIRAHHTRTLAAALGVDPAAVIVTDDPVRSGRYPAYLITVYDSDNEGSAEGSRVAYRFIPEPGIDGSYLLLRPCAGCRQDIPTFTIASLADLGRVLDRTGLAALATSHARWDTGHALTCRLFHPTAS